MGRRNHGIYGLLFLFCVVYVFVAAFPAPVFGEDTLAQLVERPDLQFTWVKTSTEDAPVGTRRFYTLTSQVWRGIVWKHRVVVVTPRENRYPDAAVLIVNGSGEVPKEFPYLDSFVDKVGVTAVLLNDVPNQPLFDGKKEDALIAMTFHNYLESGDSSWPLLVPMVKSVVRCMDMVSADSAGQVTRFVVSGSSKRGWTTWLSAAVDSRIVAIAPRVFDMLNMRKQVAWAELSFGAQSEKIQDYVKLGIVDRIDEPRSQELLALVDPYEYRKKLSMPKLLLLGTNDPYWVVDALNNYRADLPGPTAVYYAPNTGHHLGAESERVAWAWAKRLLAHEGVITPDWGVAVREGTATITLRRKSEGLTKLKVWIADAPTRDFRQAAWSSIEYSPVPFQATVDLSRPSGYAAIFLEAQFQDGMRVSSQVVVGPAGRG